MIKLLILLLPFQVYSLTVSDLNTQTRTFLRDRTGKTTNADKLFTNAELLRYYNAGQRDAIVNTWALIQRYEVTTTSGTYEYNLPTNFINIYRVLHSSRALTEVSLHGLDSKGFNWMTNTGTPTEYFIRKSTTTIIGLRPTPVSTTTGTLTVDYYSYANDLSVRTDTPFNGWNELTPYHDSLAYYAAYRCWDSLLQTEVATRYFQIYQLIIAKMSYNINASPNFRPSFSAERK